MLDIDIDYRPFRYLKWVKHLKRKLPIQWSELTEKQFIFISDMQHGIPDESKTLQVFLRISHRIVKRINSVQKYWIFKNFKYLKKPEPLEKFVIKKVLWFKAPEPQLKDVTLITFILGEMYFQSYIKGNKYDLDRFIACFYYKQPSFYNFNKKGFDVKLIHQNATIIRATNIYTRKAIAANYVLIRLWLVKIYPYAFWHIVEIQKQEKFTNLHDMFKYIFGDDLSVRNEHYNKLLHDELNTLNQKMKLQYGDLNMFPRSEGMFLDPIRFFPNVKNLNPNIDPTIN